jgi:cephalosporin hydroxylase
VTPGERAIVDAFHRLYFDGPAGEGRVFHRTTWMGFPCLKCPLDLWIYQEILLEVRPALIVETGTYHGASALFLAQVLDALGGGEVVTIDVEPRSPRPDHPRIRYVLGSSGDASVIESIFVDRPKGETCLVVLDSDHAKPHVSKELELLAPRVSPGSYLIVEDTNVNGHPVLLDFGAGPSEAVREFLARDSRFAADGSREKHLMTFNPGGYLKRKS